MAAILKTTFQLRRGDAEVWARNNPILERGEPGFEIDTNRLKIGDGETSWGELDYVAAAADHIHTPESIGALSGESDTITWDGNTDGLDGVSSPDGMTLYKISDATPTHDELAQGGFIVMSTFAGVSNGMSFTSDYVETPDPKITAVLLGYIAVVREDNYDNGTYVFPSKGIYVLRTMGGYISSFQINGYKGFLGKAMLASEKGLPNGVASLNANGKLEATQASSAINKKTGDYTLTSDDAGKLISIYSETDCTVTAPLDTACFPTGTEIDIVQMGEGTVTIQAQGAILYSMNGMTSTAGQYAVAHLKLVEDVVWLLWGDLRENE